MQKAGKWREVQAESLPIKQDSSAKDFTGRVMVRTIGENAIAGLYGENRHTFQPWNDSATSQGPNVIPSRFCTIGGRAALVAQYQADSQAWILRDMVRG